MPPDCAIIFVMVFICTRSWVKVVRRSFTSAWDRPESTASFRLSFALFTSVSGFFFTSSDMHCMHARLFGTEYLVGGLGLMVCKLQASVPQCFTGWKQGMRWLV